MSFGYNGGGNGLLVKGGTGLGDLPAIRSADPGRPRDHGEIIGLDVYGGRDFTIDMMIIPNGVSLQSAALALATATEVGLSTEQPMWFQIPNLPQMAVMCRPRKRTVPWDLNYGAASIAENVACQYHATDPRIYGAPSLSTIIDLPTPIGGMTFPATFPLAFGTSSGGGGHATISNAGNTEMRPLLVLTGPLTNPWVENSSINGSPTVTVSNPTQTGYTILSGDQLVIDLDLHSVLYYSGGVASGTAGASRRDWIVPGSQWWNLPPGSNLIHFGSDDSSQTGGTCEIQWANAYML